MDNNLEVVQSDFLDDEEKMADFIKLTKNQFLASYSYLTEQEYLNTKKAWQKREAVKRMKKLKLHENVIREFENEDKLNLSENGGILYWLNKEEQEKVKEIENEYGICVYHVIHHMAEFGECYCMLYVGQYYEDWAYDWDLLENNMCYAYVYNKDDDHCSEFGAIIVEPRIGGLIRRG